VEGELGLAASAPTPNPQEHRRLLGVEVGVSVTPD
jgi:hypothetical protein